MCGVTKAKEKCQEGPREERREGQKVSLLDGADKEGIYEQVNLRKDLKRGQKHSDEGSHPQGQRNRHQRQRRVQAWMKTRKMYLDHATSVQVPTHKYYDLGPGLQGPGMFQKGFYSSVSHTSLDSSADAA